MIGVFAAAVACSLAWTNPRFSAGAEPCSASVIPLDDFAGVDVIGARQSLFWPPLVSVWSDCARQVGPGAAAACSSAAFSLYWEFVRLDAEPATLATKRYAPGAGVGAREGVRLLDAFDRYTVEPFDTHNNRPACLRWVRSRRSEHATE